MRCRRADIVQEIAVVGIRRSIAAVAEEETDAEVAEVIAEKAVQAREITAAPTSLSIPCLLTKISFNSSAVDSPEMSSMIFMIDIKQTTKSSMRRSSSRNIRMIAGFVRDMIQRLPTSGKSNAEHNREIRLRNLSSSSLMKLVKGNLPYEGCILNKNPEKTMINL